MTMGFGGLLGTFFSFFFGLLFLLFLFFSRISAWAAGLQGEAALQCCLFNPLIYPFLSFSPRTH
jgi:hypothetical protein